MPKDDQPQPSLRPTAASTLFVTALAAGAMTLLLTSRYYQHLPTPTWYAPASLVVLSIILAYSAYSTRHRIARTPGAKPVDALLFARFVALAKASALGGAFVGGIYTGLLVFLASQSHLTAAAAELPATAFGVGACAALVAAALWLERSCRIPDEDGEGDDGRDREPGAQL